MYFQPQVLLVGVWVRAGLSYSGRATLRPLLALLCGLLSLRLPASGTSGTDGRLRRRRRRAAPPVVCAKKILLKIH